jgi:hypothetical protein
MRLLVAVPKGSTPLRSQARWLQAVDAHPATAALRADSHATLKRMAWVLAVSARRDGTTAPGWDVLAERVGVSRATVARWLSWLRHHGLLGLVETGTTPAVRGSRYTEATGNARAIYLLTKPLTSADDSVAERETPPEGSPWELSKTHAQARGSSVSPLRGPDWNPAQTTKTRRDERAAAARLRAVAPGLRSLTPRHLRSLVLPWLRSGWTVNDLLHALDHGPDGTPRTWTTSVRSPGGWVVTRLAPWRGRRAPSQQRAEERTRLSEQQQRRREAEAEAEAEALRGDELHRALHQVRAALRRAS